MVLAAGLLFVLNGTLGGFGSPKGNTFLPGDLLEGHLVLRYPDLFLCRCSVLADAARRYLLIIFLGGALLLLHDLILCECCWLTR